MKLHFSVLILAAVIISLIIMIVFLTETSSIIRAFQLKKAYTLQKQLGKSNFSG
ncbi:MAG: hypothetical protein M3P28_02985 [Thermoproteota archaeon]|nr:hypothetical protein [Thermoproteota archaeon]